MAILENVRLSEKQQASKDCTPYNPIYMTFFKKIKRVLADQWLQGPWWGHGTLKSDSRECFSDGTVWYPDCGVG